MRPTCTKSCPAYNSGGMGERFCAHGFFDERERHKRPQLDENYTIITPFNCDRAPRAPRQHWRS